MLSQKLIDRFRSKTLQAANGCIHWTAGRFTQGYGAFQMDGKSFRAHRVSWEIQNGPIPRGLHLCHRCDNPICVNPAHLFLGTAADNARDRECKKRGRPFKGEASNTAKLTAADIQVIRNLSGLSLSQIAKRYGVVK